MGLLESLRSSSGVHPPRARPIPVRQSGTSGTRPPAFLNGSRGVLLGIGWDEWRLWTRLLLGRRAPSLAMGGRAQDSDGCRVAIAERVRFSKETRGKRVGHDRVAHVTNGAVLLIGALPVRYRENHVESASPSAVVGILEEAPVGPPTPSVPGHDPGENHGASQLSTVG